MSDKTKHTPGPWETKPEECDKPYIRIRGTRLGSRYKVANAITPVYDGVGAREAEETRANARLIAAAPELLEALRGLMKLDEDLCSEGAIEALDKARAAIAKATGETA